jgi:hypothetical protein
MRKKKIISADEAVSTTFWSATGMEMISKRPKKSLIQFTALREMSSRGSMSHNLLKSLFRGVTNNLLNTAPTYEQVSK